MGTSAEELLLKISGDAAGGQKAVDDITAAVEKTVKALSGDGLFGAANKVTLAIQQLGGVTKLTADEQDRASTTIDKAIEKYKVMGQTAPAAMVALRDEMARAGEATGGWLPILQSLGNSWAARIAEGMLLRDAIREVITKVGEMAMALPELALKGAAVADVEEAFKRLTTQAGLLGDKLMGALRQGTHNTVTDFELMKTANKDLAAGLNLTDQQFGTLAKGAFALAQATGGDVKTALDTMNDAMLTGRTRSLALLTGKIDETAAEERYAKTLGVTVDHLTDAGKLEAKRIAILEGVSEATQRLGEQTDGLDERVAQVQVAWGNFQENLGKTIASSPVLEAGMNAAADALKNAFGDNQKTLIDSIAKAIDGAAISVLDFAQSSIKGVGFIGTEFNALKVLLGDIAQAFEVLNLGAARFERIKLNLSDPFALDPESGARLKTVSEDIDRMTASVAARGAALQADKAAEEEWAKTGDRLSAAIQTIRDRMVEANHSAAEFIGPIQQAGAAQAAAATAAGQHGAMLKQSNEEISKAKAAAEAFQKALKELDAVGVGWHGTLETIDGSVVAAVKAYLEAGVAQNELAIAYGLTAAQVKAVAESLKDEAEIRKIVNAATKEAGDATRAWIADTTKAAAEYVHVHEQAYLSAVAAAQAANDQIALSGVNGQMRQVRALEQREQAEIDALASLRKLYPDVYDQIVAVVKQKYALMTAAAVGSQKDIIDVAHELGLKTKEDVAANIELARNNYNALRDSGVLAIGELEKAWQKLHEAEVAAKGGIDQVKDSLIGTLQGLPGILQSSFQGGGGLSGAMKSLGTQIGADFGKALADSIKATVNYEGGGDKGTGVTGAGLVGAGGLGGLAAAGTAVSGGGVGAQLGSAAMSAAGVAAATIAGTASTVGLGAAAASAAALGAATMGVGAAVVGVIALIKSMGPSAQELDGRTVEANLESQFGSFQKMMDAVGAAYQATGKTAAQAQADVKALMDAEQRGGPAVQSMVDRINAVFDEQKQKAADVSAGVDDILATAKVVGGDFPVALKPLVEQLAALPGLTSDEQKALTNLLHVGTPGFEDLSQAAGRYGLTLDTLGGKAGQLSISTEADQIESDYKTLVTDSGADSDKVLAGMKDSLIKLVDHAMDAGAVLPTALEPLVKQLFNTGQLTDTAGDKITDLSKLKFDDTGDPLATGMKSLTDAINHLGDLLDPNSKTGLPALATSGAAAIGAALGSIKTPSIPAPWADWPSPPGFDGTIPIPMAAGGMGRVTRPTLFLAGERGAEDFAFSGGGKSFRGSGMGGGGITVHVTVEGNVSTERDLADAISQHIANTVLQSTSLPLGAR